MKNRTLPSRATATQISEALGVTREAVRQRAKKESWPYLEQKVRGGRQRIYTLLPDDVKAAVETKTFLAALAQTWRLALRVVKTVLRRP